MVSWREVHLVLKISRHPSPLTGLTAWHPSVGPLISRALYESLLDQTLEPVPRQIFFEFLQGAPFAWSRRAVL